MRITEIIWLDAVVDKLAWKHNVQPDEMEQVLAGQARFRFVEQGERPGEDVYVALGQAESGRYLAVLFIHKTDDSALILSARDMAPRERKQYERK